MLGNNKWFGLVTVWCKVIGMLCGVLFSSIFIIQVFEPYASFNVFLFYCGIISIACMTGICISWIQKKDQKWSGFQHVKFIIGTLSICIVFIALGAIILLPELKANQLTFLFIGEGVGFLMILLYFMLQHFDDLLLMIKASRKNIDREEIYVEQINQDLVAKEKPIRFNWDSAHKFMQFMLVNPCGHVEYAGYIEMKDNAFQFYYQPFEGVIERSMFKILYPGLSITSLDIDNQEIRDITIVRYVSFIQQQTENYRDVFKKCRIDVSSIQKEMNISVMQGGE